MQTFLTAFYVLFFATGFMGFSALLLLRLRMKSRLLPLLLLFQVLFLFGMGVVLLIYSLGGTASPAADPFIRLLLILATGTNTAIWFIVLFLIRSSASTEKRRRRFRTAALILGSLVVLKSAANLLLVTISGSGSAGLIALTGTEAWNLGGHILTGLAMATFGIVLRGPLNPKEPPALAPLMRSYGLIALIFAPAGLLEALMQASGIEWLRTASLDHFFYLAWNIVSMSAALRLFKPTEDGTPLLETVPEERVKALGLSPREAEMAVLIARGLANKQIADILCISPATVRTHIYNLYQKVGAGSRVELLNKLRS